jgi:hypothetical protein
MTGKVNVDTPLGAIAVYSLSEPVSVRAWLDDNAEVKRGPLVVIINDTAILRKDWDSVLITPNDRTIIMILPARGRGGLKTIIRAVASIGLAVAATLVAGPLGGVLGITSSLGISLIGAGVFLAGSVILNRLLPASTSVADQSSQQPTQSPTYNFQAQGNFARLGSPVPKLYGNHIVFPDYFAPPYSRYDIALYPEIQHVYLPLVLGLGRYRVEQIYVGDTLAWDMNTGSTEAFAAAALQVFIITPGGDPTSAFWPYYYTSPDVSSFDLKAAIVMGPFDAVPKGCKTTSLEFDFVMPNGLNYTDAHTGTLFPVTVTITCDYQLIDDHGVALSDWVQNHVSFLGASLTELRRTFAVSVGEGRYRVRVTRIDGGPPAGVTTYISDTSWTAVRAYLTKTKDAGSLASVRYPDVTLLMLAFASTNTLSPRSSNQISVVMTSILPERLSDGSWGTPSPTRKMAAIISDMLRADYGPSLTDDRIDLDKLWTLQTKWSLRADYCDRIFDQKLGIWDAIATVLKCGRTRPIMIGNQISFVRDEQRQLYKQSFTPRNVLPNSLEATYVLQNDDIPDDVIVTFVNRLDWKPDQVRVSITGIHTTSPITYDYTGITDAEHATREALYQAANNLYRRRFAKFGTELENRFLLLGDLISVAHDVPLWGQFGGLKALAGNTFTADRDFDWNALPAQHYATITLKDGRVMPPMPVSRGDSDADLLVTADDLATALDALGIAGTIDDFLVFVSDDNGRSESRVVFGPSRTIAADMLVSAVVPNNELTAIVEAVLDDPRVYAADGVPDVPIFAHPITDRLLAGIDIDLGRILPTSTITLIEDLGRITPASPAVYEADLGSGL